jgi:hypothetical protein
MSKFVLPLLIVAFFIGFYEQSKDQPNVYVVIVCVAAFMFGMAKLMSKVPSKNPKDKDGIL